MNDYLWATLIFGGGLAILFISGDMLTRSSVRMATFFKINPLIIGLIITAFATSAPEAAIVINSALNNEADIALGNIIGSNIANILLVLGLPAIFINLNTDIKHIRRHFLIMAGASILFTLFALSGEIGLGTGIVFLLSTAAWVVYSLKSSTEKIEIEHSSEDLLTIITMGAGAAVGLWLGAKLTIEGGEKFAEILGISKAVMGLTLIAIGTSLPELATSITAIWKKHHGIAIGNVLGSNVLNIIFVLGVGSVITPLSIDRAFLQLDIPVMIGAILLFAPFAWWHKPLTKISGLGFLGCYILYIISLTLLRPSIIG